MSFVSDYQQNLLRTRPHRARLAMSIYQPPTVLSCQLNSVTGTVGAYVLPYDNVVTGSYSNVTAGMTLLVGTQPGYSDVGRIRVRSATASAITVAENSDINWRDNLYLTVIKFYELWPIFAYYELTGDVVAYKDYDVAYTNQNSVLGSLICMGPHHAGYEGETVYYTATGTVFVAGPDTPRYSWVFEGGVPGTSTAQTPGYVAYPNDGHYTTKLTVSVTGSSASDTSYRHVSIYNRSGVTNIPIRKWNMEPLSGSREDGAYVTRVIVRENTQSIMDGALVVLFADDEYGAAHTSLGGNAQNRSKTFFVGYIKSGSIQYDYAKSIVEFEVVSVTDLMKALKCSGISVDSVVTPDDWFELPDMDVRKALYHFLRWHTTLLNVADVQYLGENYKFQYFETDPSTMYDAIDTFTRSSLHGRMMCDRQGKVFIEPQPDAINGSMTGTAIGMYIDRRDWVGEPSLELPMSTVPLAYLEMGGVAYSGAVTGTYEAFISAAPGDVSTIHGNDDDRQGLILTTQANLNRMVGDVFAYENAKYPSLSLDMAGNYRNFDVVPLERHLITITPTDSQGRLNLVNHPFHLTNIEWSYDSLNEMLVPHCTFHEMTQGYAGATVPIYQAPQDNFPPQPDVDDPTWPLLPPWRPPGPVPDNKPPDPEVSALCRDDLTFPPNGPFTGVFSTTVRSDYDRPWIDIPWLFFMRSGQATYKTQVTIDGCFKISTNGGNSFVGSTEDFVSVWAEYDGGKIYGVRQSAFTGCEQRTWLFTPPVGLDCSRIVVELPKALDSQLWSTQWPITAQKRQNPVTNVWVNTTQSFTNGTTDDVADWTFAAKDAIVDIDVRAITQPAQMVIRYRGYLDSGVQLFVYGQNTTGLEFPRETGDTQIASDPAVGNFWKTIDEPIDISGYDYIRIRMVNLAAVSDVGAIAWGYITHNPTIHMLEGASVTLWNVCEFNAATYNL